jgi:hypothetical protein
MNETHDPNRTVDVSSGPAASLDAGQEKEFAESLFGLFAWPPSMRC